MLNSANHKLANRKNENLSMGGKLIILKATINSLPLYCFNLYKIPATTQDGFELLRKRFIWSVKKANITIKDKILSS